jgi:hypothetical protein
MATVWMVLAKVIFAPHESQHDAKWSRQTRDGSTQHNASRLGTEVKIREIAKIQIPDLDP